MKLLDSYLDPNNMLYCLYESESLIGNFRITTEDTDSGNFLPIIFLKSEKQGRDKINHIREAFNTPVNA